MNGRELFLQRVRQAVADGNRAGTVPPLPERGNLGYQGGGPDPVEHFRAELIAAGGHFHQVSSKETARLVILDLVHTRQAKKILLGRGPFLDPLDLSPLLTEKGLEVWETDSPATNREELFAADLGISGVAYLIAETGTVVAASGADEPRALSLLPPIHIAVAHRSQALPDLFDLFSLPNPSQLPSSLTLITGPSKTGDIELKLVTGVHGPGEIHLVLVGTA